MAGCYHYYNGHELGQISGDGKGQRGLACCSSCGHKELDATEQLNSNKRIGMKKGPWEMMS